MGTAMVGMGWKMEIGKTFLQQGGDHMVGIGFK